MSDTIALHIHRHQVHALEAHLSKAQVHVRRGCVLVFPDTIDPVAQTQEAAEWLKGQLRRHAVRGRRVIAVLPREDLVVRRLELPPAPDEELASMVRLQAATNSPTFDRMLLDFIALPSEDREARRSVLTVAATKERVTWLKSLLEAAGYELQAVAASPAAIAELAVRAESARGDDPHRPSLVLIVQPDHCEIVITYKRRLVTAHAVHLDPGEDQQGPQRISAEVTRLLVACQGVIGENRIARIWLVGAPPDGPLGQTLAQRLDGSVRTLELWDQEGVLVDRQQIQGSAPMFAACLGALLATAGSVAESIDLLHPRQPPPPKNVYRRRWALAAVMTALLLGAGYLTVKLRRSDLDEAIAARQSQLAQLDPLLQRMQPRAAAAELVRNWEARSINWLEHIQRVQQLMPDNKQVYLSDLRADPAVGDVVARVKATGFARDQDTIEQLYQQLDERGYRVYPQPIQYRDDDREYPYRFELNFELPAPANGGSSATSRSNNGRLIPRPR